MLNRSLAFQIVLNSFRRMRAYPRVVNDGPIVFPACSVKDTSSINDADMRITYRLYEEASVEVNPFEYKHTSVPASWETGLHENVQ
jgi:hypothetical protein